MKILSTLHGYRELKTYDGVQLVVYFGFVFVLAIPRVVQSAVFAVCIPRLRVILESAVALFTRQGVWIVSLACKYSAF